MHTTSESWTANIILLKICASYDERQIIPLTVSASEHVLYMFSRKIAVKNAFSHGFNQSFHLSHILDCFFLFRKEMHRAEWWNWVKRMFSLRSPLFVIRSYKGAKALSAICRKKSFKNVKNYQYCKQKYHESEDIKDAKDQSQHPTLWPSKLAERLRQIICALLKAKSFLGSQGLKSNSLCDENVLLHSRTF